MSHSGRGPGRFMIEKAQRTRPTRDLLERLWGYLGKFWFFLAISGLLILFLH